MISNHPPVALQLYTVRDVAERDLPAAIEKTAELGFKGVEFAGLFGNDPEKVRATLDRTGLKACSAHYGLDQLTGNLQSCIDEAKTIGYDILVVPYLTDEYRSEIGYERAVDEMLEAAETLWGHNLRLAYHHHNFEFLTLGPESALRGIDIIINAPSGDLLLEIDLYWARHGGADPLTFLRRHIRRTPLVHMKDMLDPHSKKFTEIGEGIIDFAAILELVNHSKVEWLIIEQDADFRGSSFDSAEQSLQALRELCIEAFV